MSVKSAVCEDAVFRTCTVILEECDECRILSTCIDARGVNVLDVDTLGIDPLRELVVKSGLHAVPVVSAKIVVLTHDSLDECLAARFVYGERPRSRCRSVRA